MLLQHPTALAPARPWPRWPLLTILTILFAGPIAAPLFQASGVGPMIGLGGLAHDLLATYICPTPAKSYFVASFPMAVCARCWGATIGLWLGYALFRRGTPALGGWLALPWLARLGIAALPFWLWVAEIVRWEAAPLPILLLNGALAGLAAGLFFCSIWPGMRPGDIARE